MYVSFWVFLYLVFDVIMFILGFEHNIDLCSDMKTFCSGFIIVKTSYCSSLREKESAVFPIPVIGNTAVVNFCRMSIVPTFFNLICIRWGEGLPFVTSWNKWLGVKCILYIQ